MEITFLEFINFVLSLGKIVYLFFAIVLIIFMYIMKYTLLKIAVCTIIQIILSIILTLIFWFLPYNIDIMNGPILLPALLGEILVSIAIILFLRKNRN